MRIGPGDTDGEVVRFGVDRADRHEHRVIGILNMVPQRRDLSDSFDQIQLPVDHRFGHGDKLALLGRGAPCGLH